jgi:hypothetical protein
LNLNALTGVKQATPLHLSHELNAIQSPINRTIFRFFIDFEFKINLQNNRRYKGMIGCT